MIEDTELREKINKEWGSLRDGHSINIWKISKKKYCNNNNSIDNLIINNNKNNNNNTNYKEKNESISMKKSKLKITQ